MKSSTFNVKLTHEDAKVPTRATDESAGYDLFSPVDVTILGKSSASVNTHIIISMDNTNLPDGYIQCARIASRSGLHFKYSIDAFPGVIDSDFVGEIVVGLNNTSSADYHIKKGERIAQLIFTPVYIPTLNQSVSTKETNRGTGGFGSTGK